MPNVLLTTVCNRTCPYCFAKERVAEGGEQGRHLSLDDLVVILDFLEKSGVKVFNVLGGEPTLHPRFTTLLSYILNRGFVPHIFTNAIVPPPVRGQLRDLVEKNGLTTVNLRFVANVNEEHLRSSRETLLQEEFFGLLGALCGLSYNIYRTDQDFSFLLDLIARHGLLKQVRLGLAQPIPGAGNAHLHPRDYPAVFAQVLQFARECDRRDVALNFDCGFPLCHFTDAELGELYRANVQLGFRCGPCIDIAPDLSVWYCFPLSIRHAVSLTDFTSLPELAEHLQDLWRRDLPSPGILEHCAACAHRIRNQCAGGCKAHLLVHSPAGEVTAQPCAT
jgi:MoaA/NifB/PqqE/SkfB family radical SAM enzyme